MPSILVRDLEKDVVNQLKKAAREHGRSLQAEVKSLIHDAVLRQPITMDEFWKRAEAIRKRTRGRTKTDSVDLVREDRDL
jgi:plasmid stability protein